jgi:stage III sporulation protein SpoIIIAA
MTTQQMTPFFNAPAPSGPGLTLVTPDTARSPLAVKQHQVTDNLEQLLDALPGSLRTQIENGGSTDDLLEIVMDLGRIPEARYAESVLELGSKPITAEDIDYVIEHIGSFGKDNRAGIERTLHRISAIRNRQGKVVGLTCRIGRAVYGTIDIIQDIVESGKSILMLGRPGRGKTTKLREVARILSEELRKRVVIVDTSNEIAGDGDIPHPAIGKARRMQVAAPELQHAVMIEAVENHMPEVIVIDEIGTEQEAFAARTIAERGVQLIGTAHGNSLENLMMNPTLSDLVGGIQAVTLSDDEAKRRGTQKTVLERKAPPTFDVIIEIMEVDKLALHLDVERTVDKLLRGAQPRPEIRIRNAQGQIEVIQKADESFGIREMPERPDYREPNGRNSRPERPAPQAPTNRARQTDLRQEPAERAPASARLTPRPASVASQSAGANVAAEATVPATKPLPTTVRIFPYGVSRSRLDRAIIESRLPAYIARDLADADVVIALKATYKREPGKMREAAQRRLPVSVVRSNTYAQIANSVREIFGMKPEVFEETEDELDEGLNEVQDAVELVKRNGEAIELAPANSYTRRLQHQIVERHQLTSESIGVDPQRRVRILPIGS